MNLYTVHEPAGGRAMALRQAEDVVFVKEGLCWPALFLPLLWQIYHGMWLVLILYVAIGLGLEYLIGLASETLSGIAAFCFALLFALEANNLRRWHLARKGHVISTVVSGRNLEEAELRYFARWLQEDAVHAASAGIPAQPAAPIRPIAPAGMLARTEPIGVFPRPGGGA